MPSHIKWQFYRYTTVHSLKGSICLPVKVSRYYLLALRSSVDVPSNRFSEVFFSTQTRVCILVQTTIYRRLRIGRNGHLDESEAYDIAYLVREYGPSFTADMCCISGILSLPLISKRHEPHLRDSKHANLS